MKQQNETKQELIVLVVDGIKLNTKKITKQLKYIKIIYINSHQFSNQQASKLFP